MDQSKTYWVKEARHKSTYCMISDTWNYGKGSPIHDREQISGWVAGMRERWLQSNEAAFWGDGYAFDCGSSYTSLYICQNLSTCASNWRRRWFLKYHIAWYFEIYCFSVLVQYFQYYFQHYFPVFSAFILLKGNIRQFKSTTLDSDSSQVILAPDYIQRVTNLKRDATAFHHKSDSESCLERHILKMCVRIPLMGFPAYLVTFPVSNNFHLFSDIFNQLSVFISSFFFNSCFLIILSAAYYVKILSHWVHWNLPDSGIFLCLFSLPDFFLKMWSLGRSFTCQYSGFCSYHFPHKNGFWNDTTQLQS